MTTKVEISGNPFEISNEEMNSLILKDCHYLKEGIYSIAQVKPKEIDRSIFDVPRKDEKQEELRKFILRELKYADSYVKDQFNTFDYIILNHEFRNIYGYVNSKVNGNSLAYYLQKSVIFKLATSYHQAMLWAYRISKGETWESICNEEDKIRNPRIIWVHGGCVLLGGRDADLRKNRDYEYRMDYVRKRNVDYVRNSYLDDFDEGYFDEFAWYDYRTALMAIVREKK